MTNRVVLRTGLVCAAFVLILSSAIFATAHFLIRSTEPVTTQTAISKGEAEEICNQYLGSHCGGLNEKFDSGYLHYRDSGVFGTSWNTITYRMTRDEQSKFLRKFSYEPGANRRANGMSWKSDDAILEAEKISDELMKLSIYWD